MLEKSSSKRGGQNGGESGDEGDGRRLRGTIFPLTQSPSNPPQSYSHLKFQLLEGV